MEQTLVNGIADNFLHNIFNDLSVGLELYDKDGLMIDVNYSRLRSMGIKDKKDILGYNLFNYTSFSDEIKEQIRKGETVRFVAKYDFDTLRRLFLPICPVSNSSRLPFLSYIMISLKLPTIW